MRSTWSNAPVGTSPVYELPDYTYTGQYSYISDAATDLGANASFGLMFYNARWYDPVLGRFTSADSIIPGAGSSQAWDRYAYSMNNVLRYIDPNGHKPHCPDSIGCPEEPKDDDPGICVDTGEYNYCSGTLKSNLELTKWSLLDAPPYDWKNLPNDLASIGSHVTELAGYGIDAYESASSTPTHPLLTAGLDATSQFLEDYGNSNLSDLQKTINVAEAPVQGALISTLATGAANKAALASLDGAVSLAVASGQIEIAIAVPAAVWIGTYATTTYGLNWLWNQGR
jgi:RHS repeat-associated protein